MSEYTQTARAIILSFALGQVVPVDNVRIIVEDYLATPDERDYKFGECVACGIKHKSRLVNLCADHRKICLICRETTGLKKCMTCHQCSHTQDMNWILNLGQTRCRLYFEWYGIKIFPSRAWPKANSATLARQKREAESVARQASFLIGEILKPADQRIAELTRKLYEANEIITELRTFARGIPSKPRTENITARSDEPRPTFPYF